MPAPIWPAPTTPSRDGSLRAMLVMLLAGGGLRGAGQHSRRGWTAAGRQTATERRRRRRGSTCTAARAVQTLETAPVSDQQHRRHLGSKLRRGRVLERLHTAWISAVGPKSGCRNCRSADRHPTYAWLLECRLALTGQPVNETLGPAGLQAISRCAAAQSAAGSAAASCRRRPKRTWRRLPRAPRCPAPTSPRSCAPWVSWVRPNCPGAAPTGCRRRRPPPPAANRPPPALPQAPSCGRQMSSSARLARQQRHRSRLHQPLCCCRSQGQWRQLQTRRRPAC